MQKGKAAVFERFYGCRKFVIAFLHKSTDHIGGNRNVRNARADFFETLFKIFDRIRTFHTCEGPVIAGLNWNMKVRQNARIFSHQIEKRVADFGNFNAGNAIANVFRCIFQKPL